MKGPLLHVKNTEETSTQTNFQKLLDEVVALTHGYGEGKTQTIIPFLHIARRSAPTQTSCGIINPSFCIVAQGRKTGFIGTEVVSYGAGDFVAASVDMPATGHVSKASRTSPYVGVTLDFNRKEVATIITEAKIRIQQFDVKPMAGALIGKFDSGILELFIKLLKLLKKSEEEALFVGALVKKELIYRILISPYGQLFAKQAISEQKSDQIERIVEWIRDNFNVPITIEQLAKKHHMSASALHQKFKIVTTMGPIQYQKRLRLLEARKLLLSGMIDVTTAAFEVGYESLSQFNREYKRLFGLAPLKDIKRIRNTSGLFSELRGE
ncbi:AraC family transcriptional regulator [Leptospira koniambonensis]|uniref:AraC family transcriptional regulator n=1 Tax=Leptospira koniambonensis TaxID=2484950 RepID=A0A4R9JCQ9_9LEPT|nr:AraC family transcriptional regulator [Leptospira koniambonensis]TGL36819.1 AraC family transcriptional regulator [Leptospira koniambonensis]